MTESSKHQVLVKFPNQDWTPVEYHSSGITVFTLDEAEEIYESMTELKPQYEYKIVPTTGESK